MKKLYFNIFLSILFSIGLSQTFDPETGEIIKQKKNSQKQFDPVTGEIIQGGANNQGVTNKIKVMDALEVRQFAKWDAYHNFNLPLTWGILGGGISLISIPPFVGIGAGLGEFPGFLGGLTVSIYGVPILLSKIESQPSKFVLHQSKYKSLTPDQKRIYLNEYSKELEKKRVKAIRRGQAGWTIAGFGSILFLILLFD